MTPPQMAQHHLHLLLSYLFNEASANSQAIRSLLATPSRSRQHMAATTMCWTAFSTRRVQRAVRSASAWCFSKGLCQRALLIPRLTASRGHPALGTEVDINHPLRALLEQPVARETTKPSAAGGKKRCSRQECSPRRTTFLLHYIIIFLL
jgi:hypothetical protein